MIRCSSIGHSFKKSNDVSYHGNLIANDWNELVSGALRNPIHFDEYGHLTEDKVWTNTVTAGIAGANDCDGWTSNVKRILGTYGLSTAMDGNWTDGGEFSCAGSGTKKVPQFLHILFIPPISRMIPEYK